MESALLNLINGVKDKSRQISMSFDDVKQPTVVKYAHLFQEIFTFRLTGCYSTKNYQFSNSLSFEMFDEIHHLRLEDISGIFNLSNGLRNVVTLQLINRAFTRIDALNLTKTLQDLRIVPKGDLTISTALDNIARIEIRSDYHVCLTFPKNCLNFDLSASGANVHYDDSSSMNKTLLYERLSLEINHWPNALDPKFVDDWQLYPDIDIVNRDTDDGDLYPPLTVHHGQILSLQGFSLSTWNNSLLLKIKRLFLTNCDGLTTLPPMPQVESIYLESCHTFMKIPFCPLLQTAEFTDCRHLQDISFCGHLQSITICECGSIRDIRSFERIQTLNLVDLNLETTEGISGTDENFANDHRLVIFIGMPLLQDFKFCVNIHSLALWEIPRLFSCHGIRNIHSLKIKYCSGLSTTAGLENISDCISIAHCTSLCRLEDLQGIPEVSILRCDKIHDFSGLGNNEAVCITGENTTKAFKKFEQENPQIIATIEDVCY
jgi:hypothetical protein